ncbi:MAG: rRNA maturation RNase YbeY [Bacteroidota bacterium]
MNALIQFFSEEVSFKLEHEKEIQDWISAMIHEEGLEAGVLNYIFCNDEYLLQLNQQYLDRNTLTDVIAFDYRENDDEVSGDIFISVERTAENAEKFGQSHEKELFRVIVHGALHLCGYDDHSPEEKTLMTEKEDKYLSLLPY